jgi:hypothetical protein
MASIKWTIVTDAGTVDQEFALSEASIQRYLEYIHAWFPPLDAEGNLLPRTPARDAQSFRDAADGWFDESKKTLKAWEHALALNAVPPPPDLT